MQWFMEQAQPYLQTIVLALISLVASMIVAALVELRKRVLAWIDSRTSKEQRELLHKLAEEAFSLAETTAHSTTGANKLAEAKFYMLNRLSEYGIKVTNAELAAVIEKAVLDYKAKSTNAPQ